MKYILFLFLILIPAITTANVIDITVVWDQNVDAEYYKIFYGEKTKVYTVISDRIYKPTLTHTITGLDDTKQYYFAVKAYNACHMSSDFSNEATTGKPSIVTHVIIKTCKTYESEGG